ncbi:MAG: hypothetical protein KF878_08475 [Planctomycetes bacterium]|nr:hypothetical protein [Planctomycetota bacterium]
MESVTAHVHERYEAALAEATRFFMGEADVQAAARRLAARLSQLGVPYVICGGLAVAAHGHARLTSDVGVLLTPDGLARFKERWLGRGWVERFPGSKGLQDAEHRVRVDVLLTGDYPGDGKPKPVAFPDPASVALVQEGTSIITLPALLELKLASGMTAAHRLQDLADVIALVRCNALPREFGERLHPWVRPKFDELWQAAQQADAEA